MAHLRVRIDEGTDKQPILLWDSVWSPWGGAADWAIAGADEPQNRGGLRSKAALHTAVIIALFTDKRIPDDHPLRYLVQDGDQRGWFGDGEDIRPELGEGDMGSLLWIFERAPLTEEIRKWVEAIAIDALSPLIFQKIAVRIEAVAVAEFAFDRVDLTVNIYGRDGSKIYNYKFDDVWRQTVTSPPPAAFPDYPLAPQPHVSASLPSLDFSKPGNSGYLALFGPGAPVAGTSGRSLNFSNAANSGYVPLI